MRLAACALILFGCAREAADPPPSVSGSATVATPELPVWFGDAKAPTHRIAGRVIGPGGPYAVALRIDAPDPTVWRGETQVTADGFDFGPQRAGRYHLVATSGDHASRVIEIDARDGDVDASLYAYRCFPSQRTVRVNLRPLEGATVDLAGVAVATTDRAGHFTICASAEPVAVTVRAPGYAALTSASTEIALVRARDMSGDVVANDPNKAKPAPHVAVQPILEGVPLPIQATADAWGSFTLHDVPATGAYTFRVIAGDTAVIDRTTMYFAGSFDMLHVMLGYASPDAPVALPLAISGRIVHGGAAIGDALVSMGDASTRTDRDGRFTLRYAKHAPLHVAHASGLATVRSVADGATDLTIELVDTGTIAGVAPGAHAIHLVAHDGALDQLVTTGIDGHFSFPTVESGDTYAVIALDDRGHEIVRREVVLDAGTPNVTGLELLK